MAKKKETTLTSWEAVDGALRRMGEVDIALSKIEGDMTLRINEIKSVAEVKAEGLKAERKALEKDITLFAGGRKGEFAKNRNKELAFGEVAFRVTTKIAITSVKACVSAMEALGFHNYLRVEKKPDKELMLDLDDQTLARVGATRKVTDKIRIVPNMEKVKEAA